MQTQTKEVRVAPKVNIADQSMDSSDSNSMSPNPQREAPTRAHNLPDIDMGTGHANPIQTQYYSPQHQPSRQSGPQASHFPTNQTQATESQATPINQSNFAYDSYAGAGTLGSQVMGSHQPQDPPTRPAQASHNQFISQNNGMENVNMQQASSSHHHNNADQDDNNLLFGSIQTQGGFQTNASRQAANQNQTDILQGHHTSNNLAVASQQQAAMASSKSTPAKQTGDQAAFQFQQHSPENERQKLSNSSGFDKFESGFSSNLQEGFGSKQQQAMPPAQQNNVDPFGGFNFDFGGGGQQNQPQNSTFTGGDFFGGGGSTAQVPDTFEFKPRQQGQKKGMDVQFNDFFGSSKQKSNSVAQEMEFNFGGQQNKSQNQSQQAPKQQNAAAIDLGLMNNQLGNNQGRPGLNKATTSISVAQISQASKTNHLKHSSLANLFNIRIRPPLVRSHQINIAHSMICSVLVKLVSSASLSIKMMVYINII